tara:strand:- start:55 stop:564 length:510 start_codon:yes stop_codon:yes gene_type:complete
MSEDAVYAHVIAREKETGMIPCETEEERDACLALYMERHPTAGVDPNVPMLVLPPIGNHWVINDADLPEVLGDDSFFGAWECTDGLVTINMAKARGVHMDRIRVVRNEELAAKDVTFMRAVEAGDAAAQSTIGTEKQTLRDLPTTFDLTTAGTPELLKGLWPSELPARE